MNLGIQDKTALVTGSSAGLGLAAAKALHDEGARVAICSRDKKRIGEAAITLSATGERVFPLVCDLTCADDIHGMIVKVYDAFKAIDVLVTNCGGPPPGTHEGVTEKEWQLAWDLTFMSTVRLIQGVLPDMKRRKFGRIIIISSIAAKQPVDNLILSNSYRAGLLGYAKTLSRELGPHGITINTVLPGYTRTERLEELASGISARTGKTRDAIFADWMSTVPLGRLGRPEELGQLIAFLASAQAGYITGTAIAADGGRSAGIL